MSDPAVTTHALYLLISVSFTIWVAHTLFRNGRVFLVDAFLGNETLADSVNHLLVVGFYLINIGYVAMSVKYGATPRNVQEVFEVLSFKVGVVLLILGALHFFNLLLFTRARKRAKEEAQYAATKTRGAESVPPPLSGSL
jgi:hypothetical protein